MPGTTGMSTESLPSLVGEHLTTSTALDASTSHPSTLSASSPPSSTPATVTSSPPAASDHKKDPQRRRSVILSVSTGCDLLSRPVELDNYLKPLASEIEWEKIQALERECLLKNAMHNAADNFLTSKVLQRLIRDKEEQSSARDQLLAEQEQSVIRLSELEAKATEAVALEARLQQSGQDVREATTAKKVTELEATMDSKIEKLAAMEAKCAQLEEKYRKTIEHKRLFSSTVHDLDVSLQSVRSARKSLSNEDNFLASKVLQRLIRDKEEQSSARDQLLAEREQSVIRLSELEAKATEDVALEARLQQSGQDVREAATPKKVTELEATLDSKIEKLAAMEAKCAQLEENMRRKTLEDAKAGILDLDAKIARARELELAAKNGLPVHFDASGSSGSSSEFLGTKEESEDDDAEDQTGENVEPSARPPTSPEDADTSIPPGSGDTTV
nr:filament-like plant protein [Nicotiana tomentosiformis]